MEFKINTGEFKHLISIERGKMEKNSDGIPEYTWSKLLDTRAKIVNLSGNEYLKALATGIKIDKTFYIRYDISKNINTEDRIFYNGEYYNIKYVNNVHEMNKYLEIKCEMLI